MDGGRFMWTEEADATVVEMATSGAHVSEIAARFGVSHGAAWTRMSRINARPRLDEMTQEAIVEKHEAGWRHSRIARQHGLPEAVIATVVAGYRAPAESPRKTPKSKPRPEWATRPMKETPMAKNRLSDLNDHLFMQLERLSDEDLSNEEIEKEAKRAEAIVGVADKIIANASLGIQAAKLVAGHGADPTPYLRTINATAVPAQVEDRS